MAILLKPRSNSQGVVEVTADLAQLNGRPGYQVLVKDAGLFEWVASGVVDNDNIYPALSGRWSKVLESGDITLAFTAEDSANKSLNVITDAASDVKYPSVKATKTYADSLVTGLLDDRGNFTPGGTSPGAWPTTGGSGTAGAIMKGDIWFCSASGFMGTTAVVAGSSFRAVVDTPGQTAGNWNVLSAGAISTTTPSLSQVTAIGATTAVQGVSIINNLSTATFTVSSTGGNGAAEIGYSSSSKGFLNVSNGSNTATVRANNLTGDKTFQFPDASGTLALTSQLSEPYLVYTAFLSYDGTTVTQSQLRNTIGNGSGNGIADISWSVVSNGLVRGDMSNSPFTINKTAVITTSYDNSNSSCFVIGKPRNAFPTRYIDLIIRRHDNDQSSTPLFTNLFVEIRIYP